MQLRIGRIHGESTRCRLTWTLLSAYHPVARLQKLPSCIGQGGTLSPTRGAWSFEEVEQVPCPLPYWHQLRSPLRHQQSSRSVCPPSSRASSSSRTTASSPSAAPAIL